MMRRSKLILVFVLVIGIILSFFGSVNAHSIELDPKSLIRFPMMIINGKGDITIASSETGYSLYYQAVEIPDAIYAQIKSATTTGNAEINKIEAEVDALDTECGNLKTLYDNAYNAYKTKLDSGVQDAELETLKAAYETAKTNYQNKVAEYNNKLKEYNDKVDETNKKVDNLTPSYQEGSWIKTNDRSINIDLSQFSGEKAFAVWAKLVSSNGTITYDETTYTVAGTKVPEKSVTAVSLDKSSLTLQEGSTYTLKATITPTDATNKALTWTSDNESVAKVNNGKVTAVKEGTTNITVKTVDGEFTSVCKVSVSKKTEQPNEPNENTTDDTKPNDNTTATGKLPQTGVSTTILFSIVLVIAIAVICYIKYYNYKDIK